VSASDSGTPIRIRDIGHVTIGPDLRRGVADLDGAGEAVSGIVVMRQGENAVDVIDRVKERIRQIEPGLPPGMEIVPIYDRSALIRRAIDNVSETLVEVVLTVVFIVLLFLWHVPSALIPLITLPVAVLVAFIPFQALGITANIMSLGGIAIAMGELVDAAIVVVEQTHKKLEQAQRDGSTRNHHAIVLEAVREVAPASFFALLVIAVSFLPVLALESQEGRLFKPLAYTKTLTMLVAAGLVITLDPALRVLFTRVRRFAFRPAWLCQVANAVLVGRIRSEESHPISRGLMTLYEPVVRWSLRWKWSVIAGAAMLVLVTVPVFTRLGSEFMPPLDEGSLLYMPTTMPGIAIGEAQKLVQVSDRAIRQFPEVDRVIGKAGRADTSTDPAPLSMLETVITLKPTSEWRRVDTWYSGWAPEWLKRVLRHVTPDHISQEQLIEEMNAALSYPGVSNAWTMPIKGRIDMLTTGIRTPVGLKVSGVDFAEIEKIGTAIEAVLPAVSGTRNVFAERTGGGFFLDIEWNRDALARYGLSVEAAQGVVQNAIGGENVTTTIEGRERYPVNVRYMRDFRSDTDAIGRVLVPASDGQRQIPLGELARVTVTTGPAMIRNENGLLTGYVFVDVAGRDISSYVDEARRVVREQVTLPPGYAILWSGQYEAMARVRARLAYIIPITLLLVCVLLYLNTRSLVKTSIVLLAVPFSAVGAIWYLYLLDYNMSIAVWVGLIALLGVDAQTGVFMLLYLDLAYGKAGREGRLRTRADLQAAIVEGAAKRLRPKFMTMATTFVGLLPIMWATGTGSDVWKRIAAPMVGGILTSFVLELVVYPAIYEIWKWHFEMKRAGADPQPAALAAVPSAEVAS
jgi:Cu(I)/Ag(I) efflux system membrane protein CusA/SilA